VAPPLQEGAPVVLVHQTVPVVGRRKRARRRGTVVPVAAASVVALAAATSNAIALQSIDQPATPLALDSGTLAQRAAQAQPESRKLSLAHVREEREAAATRSSRDGSTRPTSREQAADRAQQAAEARDRAAWEELRVRDLAEVARSSGGRGTAVMDRVVRWVVPLDSYRLSAGFGQSGSLWSSNHTGQDFAASTGTPVKAVGAGRIIFSGWDGSYGNKIEVRHADGTVTWYCHLSDYAQRSGYVAAGEVIGYVGSTGNSTGPHLHLEVRPGDGDPVSPRAWFRELGIEL
jgi:murein DD-endopeptidase MepM/ murein hydrolase activator NlpD